MKNRVSASALALALLMTGASVAQAQMPPPLPAEALVDAADPIKADWLRSHVVIDGPVAGGLTFAFPEGFYANRLILLGESHGVAAPQELDLELLTHLNQRIGLVDYLAEVDPVQAEWLNRYLVSGDEAHLDRVFDHWSRTGAQWGNAAFESKVRGIRALNQTLPEAQRVRFLGIDAVQDWALLAEWAAGEGLMLDAAALEAATTGADKARVVLAAMPDAPSDGVARRVHDLMRDLASGTRREQAIFNSYQRAVTNGDLGDRPAYGLWGVFHVMQAGINGAKPFATLIRQSDLPAARSMASIVVLSLDSAVQLPAPTPQGVQRMRLTNMNIDGPYVMVKGAATLRAASQPGRITVFDPSGEGSPFGAGGDFMNIRTAVRQDFTPDDPTLPTSAYAQYIGVFRDSDWAPPRP